MKRLFSILMAIMFAVIGFAQEIPKSYDRKIKRQTKKVERMEEKYHVVLPPEASVPLLQTYEAMPQLENWGVSQLEILKYKDKITSKKNKGKVLVVVFDTAGKLDHPSLLKVALEGFDYTGDGLKDNHGHGTHVSGIIASDFSTIGIAQSLIASGNIKILPVKILHDQGYGLENEMERGILETNQFVKSFIDEGWKVVYSNSWGSQDFSEKIDNAFKEAYEMGITITAASGNSGSNFIGHPASSQYVLSCGALKQNSDGTVERDSYSQYGKGLNFIEPGTRIYSTYKNGSFAYLTGTSMADPHLTAVLAIALAYFPDATVEEVKYHLQKNASDLPPTDYDIFNGHGFTPIGAILENEPGPVDNDPDDPDDPGDAPEVIKPKRNITIPLDGVDIVWGIGSFQDQRKIDVELVVEVTSTRLAELEYDSVADFTTGFFHNRGLMFRDPTTDVWDASKWVILFYEMFAENDGHAINVDHITVTDSSGRKFIKSGEGLSPNTTVLINDLPVIYKK